jgi:hypothetical protein
MHKPLSSENSRELFYRRLVVGKSKNSYDKSAEISENVIRKCGGVPLAIITIASLLASKPAEDWPEVYNSIGFGDGNNIHVDNTRKILLFSYYDLPFDLRACLLYLSLFPEDSEIEKDALIWKWVAEGFVNEKHEMGLFASGENCFNELINRSMLLPEKSSHEDGIFGCRVHDLVLDMILSLSKEEKFVTAFHGNKQCTFSESNSRRIAIIQKRSSFEQQEQNPNFANMRTRQVRTFVSTRSHLGMMPSLSSFQALRVLALERCTFTEDHPYDLVNLGRLLHLRYLEILDMPIADLPTEIGNLKFLQTLSLLQTHIPELPQSVSQLVQLKCLRYDGMVSDWIGNLISLEELSFVIVSPSSVKELGKLTEMREFRADFEEFNNESFKVLMESVGNMQKLQTIKITPYWFDVEFLLQLEGYEAYVPPRGLRCLRLNGVVFPRLPVWIDYSFLPHLTELSLMLKVVEARGVEILGRFSELVTLDLSTGYHDGVELADLVVGAGAFSRLRCLATNATLTFLRGAMPSLECVYYWLKTPQAMHHTCATIGNLLCLEEFTVYVKFDSDALLKEANEAFGHALKDHPKRPSLYVRLS